MKYDKMIVHDTRYGLNCPQAPGWFPCNVHPSAPLSHILTNIRRAADYYAKGRLTQLMILGHGLGDGGIELGSENINWDNVHQWSAIQYKVGLIQLRSCRAADSSHEMWSGGMGDGMWLCSNLASFSRSYVEASTVDQIFWTWSTGRTEILPWTGPVYTWNPWGSMIGSWYDNSGQTVG